MIAPVVLSLLTGIAVPAASPSPSPSAMGLPEIVHTITSKSCATLNNAIMPMGFVTKKDDEAFSGMQQRLEDIFSQFGNHDAPTRAELMKLGASKDATTGSQVDQIDPSGQDDTLLYSPQQVLKAAQIDTIANVIYHNLEIEQQVYDKSLEDMPAGVDPKTDEMRAHAQSLMVLQRSLADKYEDFSKTYLNNQNQAWTQDPAGREFFKAYLRALLLGEAVSMNSADSGASGYHYLNANQRARIGSVADVVQGLRQEEQAFGPEELSTYNECNGTHFTMQSPSPAPH